MKILITGGTGFIGTNFLNILDDYNVVLVDNLSHSIYIDKLHNKSNTTFYKADVRDRQQMFYIFKNEKPDIVFHFAGLVSIYDCNNNPYEAITNNILGTINVFDAAIKNKCNRIIFSESSAVYENCNMHSSGYKEEQSDPVTIYSATKSSIATLAKSYAHTKGLKYTALRYFNVAGPLQDYHRTVPPLFAGVALRLLGNNNPIIFGDGTRRRDFIHVDDVNNFHLKCITDNRTINQTFNIGTGISSSLFEICEKIHKYLNIKNKLEYDFYPEINGEAHTIVANIDKAKSIGWLPQKNIDIAIKDTIDYLQKEIDNGIINTVDFMNNLNIKDIKI